MKFTIKHEIRGRIRIHNCQKTMSADQADELQYYLITKDFVTVSYTHLTLPTTPYV